MGTVKDLTGKRFGMLTVMKQVGFTERNKHGLRYALWLCKCDCGNQRILNTGTLTRTTYNHSCGCLGEKHLKEITNQRIMHGMTGTRLMGCYKGMMSRCYRNKDVHYRAYGGRGITVCDEWKNNKKSFFEWALTHGYRDDLTIERIDVNGNYEPSNCTWIPKSEQYENKRQNIMIERNGERHSAARWSRLTGISANTIRWRYKKGWPVEKILPLPAPYQGGE